MKKRHSIVIVILITILSLAKGQLFAQVNTQDSLALVNFYDSTNGPAWVNATNWLHGPVITWHGITLDTVSHTRVFKIELPENNIKGRLTYTLGNLINLDTLNLERNQLQGTIPSSLGNLTALKVLNLKANTLTGDIPASLNYLFQLQQLNLSFNLLSGCLTSFSLLSHLTQLSLAYNNLNFTGLDLIATRFSFAIESPQQNLQVFKTRTGAGFTELAVAAGGGSQNNTYSWYKDGVFDHSKAGDSSFIPKDSGSYFVIVKNSSATNLFLYSNTYKEGIQHWVYLAADSTVSQSQKVNDGWQVNSMAYHNEGVSKIYAGGTFKDNSGKVYIGAFARTSSTWSNDGYTEGNGIFSVLQIASDKGLPASSPIYAYEEEPVSGDDSVVEKSINGWAALKGSGDIQSLATNNHILYGFDVWLSADGLHAYSGISDWTGSKWNNLLSDSMKTTLIYNIFNSRNVNFGYPLIETNTAGDVFAAYDCTDYNNSSKVIILERKQGSTTWKVIGTTTDYSDHKAVSQSGIQNGHLAAMAVSVITGGDIYVSGTFQNASHHYYILKINPSNGTTSEVPFYPNDEITALTYDEVNLYAAGAFTDIAGYPFVAKIDNLQNITVLGTTSLNTLSSSGISSICHGDLYTDDIFVAGLFTINANETYYLAHYSSFNCTTIGLSSTSANTPSGTVTTFYASTTNAGNNPLFIWKKNNYTMAVTHHSTYMDSVFLSGDSITCVLYGNSDCSIEPVQASIKVTVAGTVLSLNEIILKAVHSQNTTLLTWQTENEIKVSYFSIERSTDGINFKGIGKVNGGTSNNYINLYNFKDFVSVRGMMFYRIKVINNDGSYLYSNTVKVVLSKENDFTIFPNPVKSELNIWVNSSKIETVTVQVIDKLGRVIQQQTVKLTEGENKISLQVTNLIRGSYLVLLKGESILQKQFIKY